MKTVMLLLLCLGVAQPAESHIDIMAALHKGTSSKPKFDILAMLHGGHKKKPQSDPTGVLSSIMAAAGQGLALAEKHHEVAVQQARSQLQILLTNASGALSHAIQQYNATLAGALTSVGRSMNTSKGVLAKAEKAAASDSWESKSGQAQATLNAQVAFVGQEIRKAERKKKASMRQSISSADFILEGDTVKLSRKVGDISEMVKQTQDDMEAKAAVVPMPTPVSFLQQKGGESMDCDKAVVFLRAATQQLDAAATDGLKTMTATFAKVEQALTSGVKSITDKLDASQDEEIRGVRSAAASPPKPALRAHHKHA